MRILYFTQFYSPECMAASFRATDHSRIWAKEGHDVTVFTCWPNYPLGIVFDGYDVKKLGSEVIEGVKVFRSKSTIQSNKSLMKRVQSGLSILFYGLRNTLGKKSSVGSDYDVVLATSGIIFTALLGSIYARHKRIPLVVEIRDITYKQIAATSGNDNGWKTRLMRMLELSICKKADALVVVTKGFKKTFSEAGIPEKDIFVVPNGADIIDCSHSWSDALRLGYFGTMGISQDVSRTLAYSKIMHDDGGLVQSYLLIGEGAARSQVEAALEGEEHPFVTLMHGMPSDELEPYYADVDMTVVSLQKSSNFAETIPSKIFQSFARGVPVLFVGPDGEAASIVRESGAGVALCGNDEEDIAALKEFASQKDLPVVLDAMSRNAVSYMEANYTRKKMASKMLEVFEYTLSKTKENIYG